MGKRLARGALVFLLAFLVGCDHVTKIAATDELSAGRVITLVKGVLDLRFTKNFDTAFSPSRSSST
jgi:lipoprotein signal peptidase